MGRAVRLASGAALLALAQSCADTASPPPIFDLAGFWDWTARRDFPANGTVCRDTGSFRFVGQGAGYVGISQWVGSCQQPTISYVNQTDSLLSVTVTGSTLTFVRRNLFPLSGVCSDTALITAGATSELVGTSTCTTARVSWRAVRGGPVVAVAVSPPTLLTVPGMTFALAAVLRTASANHVFGRTVAWSTDGPGVLTVDSSGRVMPLAVGSANVVATVEGHTGSSAVTVLPPTALRAVNAGNARTCALGADGYIYCWGMGTAVPRPVLAPVRFVALSLGSSWTDGQACGLAASGSVYCWGADYSAVAIEGGPPFGSLAVGGQHACGLTSGGAAWCWGVDSTGQLGNGSTSPSTQPVAVAGGLSFQALSAGRSHTCGIAVGGALYCWGGNDAGQLGDGTTTLRTVPVPVVEGLAWVWVSAGDLHTCAVTSAGVAYCWGDGSRSQLGTGTTASHLTPAAVVGGHVFMVIAAGRLHSCGVDGGGAAWCWGRNDWGQLGNGTWGAPSASPVAVAGGLTFGSISAGVYLYSDESVNWETAAHTCGVTTSGLTYCWGVNNTGQVGSGQAGFSAIVTPTKVVGQP